MLVCDSRHYLVYYKYVQAGITRFASVMRYANDCNNRPG